MMFYLPRHAFLSVLFFPYIMLSYIPRHAFLSVLFFPYIMLSYLPRHAFLSVLFFPFIMLSYLPVMPFFLFYSFPTSWCPTSPVMHFFRTFCIHHSFLSYVVPSLLFECKLNMRIFIPCCHRLICRYSYELYSFLIHVSLELNSCHCFPWRFDLYMGYLANLRLWSGVCAVMYRWSE